MGGQHGVVRLNNSSRYLRRRRNCEGKLRLASVVYREPLKEKRSETGPGTATGGMEDKESLETGAVVGQFPDPVEDKVHDFLGK